jgi:hypothetical protein
MFGAGAGAVPWGAGPIRFSVAAKWGAASRSPGGTGLIESKVAVAPITSSAASPARRAEGRRHQGRDPPAGGVCKTVSGRWFDSAVGA